MLLRTEKKQKQKKGLPVPQDPTGWAGKRFGRFTVAVAPVWFYFRLTSLHFLPQVFTSLPLKGCA